MQQGMMVQPPARHTGLGTASLVLGIIGLIMSAIIFGYIIGIILGILAIIFGGMAYWGAAKDKFGLAGFILGLIALILAIVWIVVAALVWSAATSLI